MSISSAEFAQMLARTSKGKLSESSSQFQACSREVGRDSLHSQIEAYCRQKMWPYVHSRTDLRSTTIPGTPDFIIAADGGRVFWIECKTRLSKQTDEQKGFEVLLEMNGHKYHLVRSLGDFVAAVENPNKGSKM